MDKLTEAYFNSLIGNILAEDKKKWIQKTKMKKGKLHRKLGVPEGEKIPQEKLSAAYNKAKKSGDTTTVREINLARTLGKLKK